MYARSSFAIRALTVVVTVIGLGAVAYGQAEKKGEKAAKPTVDNLMAAYAGESNAHARYVAFAKKADEEGYGPVASLFRAAARAEDIHAKNHAEVIKKLGAEPKVDLEKPTVKGTKENLQAAIAGETYERDTMYPEFIAAAKKENNKDAVRTFNFALTAEAEHAKLYSTALNALDSWKGAKKTFYVCSVCGYTIDKKPDFEKCSSCFSPKEKYEEVN